MSAPPPQSNYDIIVLIPLAFLLRPAIGLLDIQKSKKGFDWSNNCIKLMLLAWSVTFKVKFQETQIEHSQQKGS